MDKDVLFLFRGRRSDGIKGLLWEGSGLHISRQVMSNWTFQCANWDFKPVYERIKEELLKYHVSQCDETLVQVINEEQSGDSS